MAYREGDRYQQNFFPPSFDEYVSEDDPVRVYDAFVDSLDLKELDIALDYGKVGNPSYHPSSMLKLLLYGYSYGIRSGRKLERACHHNISFLWLMGGLKPDFKTITLFRSKNRKALSLLLRQCARLCIKLDLIEGNTLFVDGSKFRASAGSKNFLSRKKAEIRLAEVDAQIEKLLDECDAVDASEEGSPSLVKVRKELRRKEKLKASIKKVIDEFGNAGDKLLNRVDPDCRMMKGIQGSHASYNVQSVADERHGLLVNMDVTQGGNDYSQLAGQVKQAEEVMGKPPSVVCTDSGYTNVEAVRKVHEEGITLIAPTMKQASKKELPPFDKTKFRYERDKDCYICPEGHTLEHRSTNRKRKEKSYLLRDPSLCRGCSHFGECTDSRFGRKISRHVDEDHIDRLKEEYIKESSQQTYRLRKQKVELPFGHIKHNLGAREFLLRGMEGVKVEISILASCFNLRRMITILGAREMIAILRG